jgi:hypothetical protein
MTNDKIIENVLHKNEDNMEWNHKENDVTTSEKKN